MKNQPESPKDEPKGYLFTNLKSIGPSLVVEVLWLLFRVYLR